VQTQGNSGALTTHWKKFWYLTHLSCNLSLLSVLLGALNSIRGVCSSDLFSQKVWSVIWTTSLVLTPHLTLGSIGTDRIVLGLWSTILRRCYWILVFWRWVHPHVRARWKWSLLGRYLGGIDVKVSDFFSHYVLMFSFRSHCVLLLLSLFHYVRVLLNDLNILIFHPLSALFLGLLLIKWPKLFLGHPLWFLNLRIIENHMYSIHLFTWPLILRGCHSNIVIIHFDSFLFLLYQLVCLINFLHSL
jgi:hypothetical protein